MSDSVQKGGFVDYYALLDVPFDASRSQIRRSFLQLAKTHHPDAGGSTDQMQLLNHAYKTLVGNMSHVAYDKVYRLHTMQGQGLGLRDDYANDTSSSMPPDAEEYVDYFVDSAYAEYYGPAADTPKSKFWGGLSKLFGR